MPVELQETLARIKLILKYIAENEGTSMRQISQDLGINYNTARSLVNVLVEEGWVKKEVGGLPRTSKLVLTEKGRCILECWLSPGSASRS